MSSVESARPSVNVTVNVGRNAKANVKVVVNTKQEHRRRLRFGRGNAKLDSAIFTFSLPAGHSCPFADACKSKANRQTGRITDGPNTEFRCYAASMEARHSSVRNSRWRNFEALRACRSKEEMVQLILDSLTPYAGYVRIHDSGDFFSLDYFDAWVEVARSRPHTVFYAYTKALPYWVKRMEKIPENLVLTASYGGTHDALIEEHGLRFAKVVYSQDQAAALGLEIDYDDSHAMRPGPSFALLIHGTQPAGTVAGKAVAALRAEGEFGHGERADAIRRERGRIPLVVT